MASAGRDLGAMALGDLGRLEYQLGVFAGDGRGRGSRAKLTSAGRAAWQVMRDVEVAGSASVGRTEAVDDLAANGLDGRTSSGYRFFDWVYVDGRRVRWGGDVEWSPGPWRLTAEGLRVVDSRDEQGLDFEDLPSVETLGWSVSLLRQFGRRTQGQQRMRLREFDLGVRLESLGFDDTGPDTDSIQHPPARHRHQAQGRTLGDGNRLVAADALVAHSPERRRGHLQRRAVRTRSRERRPLLDRRNAISVRASLRNAVPRPWRD